MINLVSFSRFEPDRCFSEQLITLLINFLVCEAPFHDPLLPDSLILLSYDLLSVRILPSQQLFFMICVIYYLLTSSLVFFVPFYGLVDDVLLLSAGIIHFLLRI